jgi:hypothetical protein
VKYRVEAYINGQRTFLTLSAFDAKEAAGKVCAKFPDSKIIRVEKRASDSDNRGLFRVKS